MSPESWPILLAAHRSCSDSIVKQLSGTFSFGGSLYVIGAGPFSIFEDSTPSAKRSKTGNSSSHLLDRALTRQRSKCGLPSLNRIGQGIERLMVSWAWMVTGAALPPQHHLLGPTRGQAISVTTRTSRTESSEDDNSVSFFPFVLHACIHYTRFPCVPRREQVCCDKKVQSAVFYCFHISFGCKFAVCLTS